MNFPRYAFGLFAVLRQKLWDAGNRGQGRGNPYNASAMFNSERALKFFSCDNEAPATVERVMGKRYANKLKEGLSLECRPITKANAQ